MKLRGKHYTKEEIGKLIIKSRREVRIETLKEVEKLNVFPKHWDTMNIKKKDFNKLKKPQRG